MMHERNRGPGGHPLMADDPVCRKSIDLNKATYRAYYENKEYGFCSQECQIEFELEPQRFVLGRKMIDPGA
jgi:YHS domain-containing protein